MVNFDNEATITTAPKEIVKIMLLERRKYLIDAVEYIHKNKQRGVTPDLALFGSRLLSLFLELYHSLADYYSKDEFKKLKKDVYSDKLADLETAFISINKWFYKKRLIKIDTIKRYDRGNVEAENKAMGL